MIEQQYATHTDHNCYGLLRFVQILSDFCTATQANGTIEGSGKTTLILNLIPQLPKTYKLALLKNEFGDLEIDSQLASSSSISGVKELLNGCICCNLVGQLGDALETLRRDVAPDRIIIETSGSAFPATLAMEVNRLARETLHYYLDGVVVVIDVENWKGYDDTSFTAKMQARYTDLIVFNKWELVDERRYDDCLDRVGDLEIQVANVRSEKGKVNKDVLLGLDSALAKDASSLHSHQHEGSNSHSHDHQSEVEVLSVELRSETATLQAINLENLDAFLSSAPKDEIYRIKAMLNAERTPPSSDSAQKQLVTADEQGISKYILNWAFGRWTFTELADAAQTKDAVLRMTIVLARDEAEKWKKSIESERPFDTQTPSISSALEIKRLL